MSSLTRRFILPALALGATALALYACDAAPRTGAAGGSASGSAGAAAPPATAPGPAPADDAGPAPDGIALAAAHAAATREPSRPDAWGGPRTGTEPTLADRVVAYDIAATLDPVRHTVSGREQLTWRNRSRQEVRSVYLHLYLNAFEGSNSTFFREARELGFEFRSKVPIHDGDWGHVELGRVRQGGVDVPWHFVHPDGGAPTDHTVVRLDLPAAVAPADRTTLDIAFVDQLPRVLARTGYFGTYHLVGQWFPKIGVLELPGERGAPQLQWNAHEFHLHSEFYADFGLYDVRLTVPQGYTVGATGEEQGEPLQADGQVTHRFVQGDVHDFAWTADRRSAPPLEAEYRGAGSPVVKVKVLYPPEYAAGAAAVLQATLDSLAYFSRALGPYPYRTVTAVVPPFNAEESGGMEYPTFFTAEGDDTVAPRTIQATAEDFTTIHEFGHQYFYGLVASNEFEEPMLDEGLNEFWDERMMRERGQPFYLATPLMNRLGLTPQVGAFDFERFAAMRHRPADGLGANSWDRLNTNSLASVYARTATALHDLEEAVGKEALERAFRAYYERWKFRHPGIADLRESLAESTGQRALVETLFEQQVYAASLVDDAIESFTSVEDTPVPGTAAVDGKWTELTADEAERQQEQARAAWKEAHPDAKDGYGPFPFRTVLTLRRRGVAVRQDVVVTFADGSVEKAVWDDPGRWRRYVWVKPVQAVSAQVDPDGHNNLDASLLGHGRTIKPDGTVARQWTFNVAALVQAVAALGAAF